MSNSKMILLTGLSMFLASCGSGTLPFDDNPDPIQSFDSSSIYTPIDTSYSTLSVEESSVQDLESTDEASSITDLSVSDISYEEEDNIFSITGAGTYEFSGNFIGSIAINAGEDDEVVLEFNNFNIEGVNDAPIYCLEADSVKIKCIEGSTNTVLDKRDSSLDEEETIGKGAIYTKSDLKFTGNGDLNITATYNNGIHSTKDVKLSSSGSIQVKALNNAIKGNDSITIESGNIIAISTGGNGLKTENTDISSKGNQRGTISILGGQVDIYSCQDGIEAAYDVVIQNDPIINIFTSNYSEYSSEVVESDSDTLYLKTSTSYSSSYRYSLLFKDSSSNTTWVDSTYKEYKEEGRGRTYYYYTVDLPADPQSFKIFKFLTKYENSEENASASTSDYITMNTSLDTVVFRDNYSKLTVEKWTSHSTTEQSGQGGGWGGQGGGMNEGNSDESEYSSKGIKAENQITIEGGSINIKCYDDGIHTNYGTTFDTSETGLGDVTISGGTININAADDGIHADRYLNITGGTINITKAYEGLEGNQIKISGGTSTIYSTDDGLNAANKAGLSPTIEISGGLTDVSVYGGDVDGIDSNGTYTQSGGIVITKGGNSNMSTGLDTDSTATVSGGSLICFGKPEKTPSTKGSVTSKTVSGSYSKGTYSISIESTDWTTQTYYSYSMIYLYSVDVSSFSISKK